MAISLRFNRNICFRERTSLPWGFSLITAYIPLMSDITPTNVGLSISGNVILQSLHLSSTHIAILELSLIVNSKLLLGKCPLCIRILLTGSPRASLSIHLDSVLISMPSSLAARVYSPLESLSVNKINSSIGVPRSSSRNLLTVY